MTDAQREELRAMLEERSRQILHETHETVTDAVEGAPIRNDVLDAAEQGFTDSVQATGSDMNERDRGLLVQIREALRRYADGTYGECVDCGEEIAFERLRAVPWATRCADDQERFDEERRAPSPPTL